KSPLPTVGGGLFRVQDGEGWGGSAASCRNGARMPAGIRLAGSRVGTIHMRDFPGSPIGKSMEKASVPPSAIRLSKRLRTREMLFDNQKARQPPGREKAAGFRFAGSGVYSAPSPVLERTY